MSLTKTFLLGAAPLAVVLLASAPGAQADTDYSKGRKHDAVEMCIDRAQQLMHRKGEGGRRLEIARMRNIEEDNDKVKVDAELRAPSRGERYTLPLDCEVSFKGDNKITYFDTDRFQAAAQDYNGRDNGRDRRNGNNYSDNRGNGRNYGNNGRDRDNVWTDAGQACRRLAQNKNYDVVNVDDRDRTQKGIRIKMDLKKNKQNFNAVCSYNENRQEASLVQVDRRGR